MNRSAHP